MNVGRPKGNLDNIASRMAQFKLDILSLDSSTVVRKHVTFGSCSLLGDDDYFELKQEVATHFHTHPSEVLVVGSAKLGFSIAAEKRYRAFGDDSDIDVAVISAHAFDAIWEEVFRFRNSKTYWPNEPQFNAYLARGWIRPDKLPSSKHFNRAAAWFDFFRNLSKSGRFGAIKISAGLYRNWTFLETYQSISVQQCVIEAKLK